MGRLVSLTDQVGTTTAFVYDDRGLVTTRTDAFGNTTVSGYDGLGRLLRSAGVGSGLASFSNATGQVIDIGIRATQGEAVGLEDFSFGQVGLSAIGGAIGGAKTAKFGETIVERAAAGFVETANQLPFNFIGTAIGK